MKKGKMKDIISFVLFAPVVAFVIGCVNPSANKVAVQNPDSVKQIIMALQDSMIEASKDIKAHPEKYERY